MVRQGRSVRAEVLVFLASFAYLGWAVWDVPLASGYIDPIGRVPPQDEALYSSIAIGMAERGEWLTPRFLGRLAFVKPILAFLPTAIAVRALGVSRFSLRLFPVLCGAAALTLFWRWGGWAAMLLLAANPLFFLLARRNMTDVPVLLAVALTIFLWGTNASAAALAWGVLTKSIAGIVPALFLWKRWARVVLPAALLVLPWHLYHLATHTDWYWREHVLDEHFQWGLQTPENAAAEPHARFYLTRAWAWDPVLTLAAPVAFAACLWRRRYREAGWLGISALVLFAFGYRNAAYLLPVFAAAALAAGHWAHWSAGAAVLGWRLIAGSISHAPPPPVPPAGALTAYCEMGRPNGLFVYGVKDELTASALPLARVQYLLPADARTLAPSNLDLKGRGIIAEAGSFADRPGPLETVLLVRSDADLRKLLEAVPGRDVLLPRDKAGALADSGRSIVASHGGWLILTAPLASPSQPPARSCRL